MGCALKTEFQRFRNQYSVWVITVILALFSSISIFTNVYDSFGALVKNICADSAVFLLAGGVYIGVSAGADFSNGFIRHYLVSGMNRASIIVSKYLMYLLGCVILLFIYPSISFLIGAFQFDAVNHTLLFQAFYDMIRALPIYLSVFSVFFMIAICLKKEAWAMGVSIALCIFLTVFPQRLVSRFPFMEYSPVIRIQKIFSGSTAIGDYCFSLFIAFSLAALSLLVSVLRFKKDDF